MRRYTKANIKIIFKTAAILFTLNASGMDLGKLRPDLHPVTPAAKLLYVKAQELIDNGSDLNIPIENKGPLLAQAAISNEHIAATLLLLSHGAHPDVIDAAGKTPLLHGAENCANRIVGALVYFGANPNHDCYQHRANKITPLHAACLPSRDSFDSKKIKERQHTLEWLLAARANTNLKDAHGCTPIFNLVALYHGSKISIMMPSRNKKLFHEARKSLINCLLACKANLEITDPRGNDLYHQNYHPVEPYLAIFTKMKATQRRDKLRALLLKFLQGDFNKTERTSPFKILHSDILKHILKQAYP